MLTMTYAAFKYKDHFISVTKLVDVMTDKSFGWTGLVDSNEDCRICARSIQQFEKKFIEFVDNQIAKDALTKASPDEEW